MPRQQSQLTLEHILLGFLANQPMHGYDLYKLIQGCEAIALIWKIKQSQLYALLEKLEKLGLLRSAQVAGEIHPWRREYQITEAGRKQLDDWMSSPVAHGRDMRQEFLARLFFASQAKEGVAANLIEKQAEICDQWISGLQASLEAHKADGGEPAFVEMVYRFRIQQAQAMRSWLEECRETLK